MYGGVRSGVSSRLRRCRAVVGKLVTPGDVAGLLVFLGGHDAQKTKATSADALSLVFFGADHVTQRLWSTSDEQPAKYRHTS